MKKVFVILLALLGTSFASSPTFDNVSVSGTLSVSGTKTGNVIYKDTGTGSNQVPTNANLAGAFIGTTSGTGNYTTIVTGTTLGQLSGDLDAGGTNAWINLTDKNLGPLLNWSNTDVMQFGVNPIITVSALIAHPTSEYYIDLSIGTLGQSGFPVLTFSNDKADFNGHEGENLADPAHPQSAVTLAYMQNAAILKGTSYNATAAGTAYTLTASYASVDFGTTDPAITIATAGDYYLYVNVSTAFNAATFAGVQSVSAKLRRTSGTPADIGTARSQPLPVITALTGAGPSVMIGPFPYTATANDVVTVQALLSATPGAGSVTVDACEITATPR